MIPKITTMMCLLISVLIVSVSAAPFYNQPFASQPMDQMMINQRPDLMMTNERPHQIIGQPLSQQLIMNQMLEQQMMEQMIQQNQYNALQQQMIAMQQAHSPYALNGPMKPILPPQTIFLLLPNTMIKSTNRIETLNESDQPNTKHNYGNPDSVTIDAENDPNSAESFPARAMVILPNGQRYIIGSIISAIPFLPFEVNVPDTIAWMYNGIAGIIGGIGQRLPFRPRPTTESPIATQEPMEPSQANRLNFLQKLIKRKNVGMPILMLPAAQVVPIQVPIEV